MFTEKQNLMEILQKSAKIDPHTQYAQIKETTENFNSVWQCNYPALNHIEKQKD